MPVCFLIFSFKLLKQYLPQLCLSLCLYCLFEFFFLLVITTVACIDSPLVQGVLFKEAPGGVNNPQIKVGNFKIQT